LVFPQTYFWWLDHYADFRSYLEAHYHVVHRDGSCVIFRLGSGGIQRIRDRVKRLARR
jgi:hypothetical protein